MRLRKRLDAGTLEAGEYRVHEGAMGSRYALLACPHCGEVAQLGAEYTVHVNGVVVPRWLCPSERCPAAEFVTLGDLND